MGLFGSFRNQTAVSSRCDWTSEPPEEKKKKVSNPLNQHQCVALFPRVPADGWVSPWVCLDLRPILCSLQSDKMIPLHLRKKMRSEKPKPKAFEVMPPVGSLMPGQRTNVQVKFMPSEEVRSDVCRYSAAKGPSNKACHILVPRNDDYFHIVGGSVAAYEYGRKDPATKAEQ